MAITTYGALRAAVANHLHRTDLDSVIADFVAIAEAQIARDVRVSAMEQTASGTLSATTLALPTRFIDVIRVKVGTEVLRYVQYEQFRTDWQHHQYSIVGGNFVFQSSSEDYEIDYFQRFEAFSADGDTNSLLTDYPDVYLYASLMAAADYISGDRSKWDALYQRSVMRTRTEEQRKRYAGRISARPDSWVI